MEERWLKEMIRRAYWRKTPKKVRASFEATGAVRLADGRTKGALAPEKPGDRFSWVITSPPYCGWRITAIEGAGSAKDGNRQADAFLRRRSEPMLEWDIWATRE